MDDHNTKLKKEAGDALWYLAHLCNMTARARAIAAGVPEFACDRIEETARAFASSDRASGYGTELCVFRGLAQRRATYGDRCDALRAAMEDRGDVFTRATSRLAWATYMEHLTALNAGMVQP